MQRLDISDRGRSLQAMHPENVPAPQNRWNRTALAIAVILLITAAVRVPLLSLPFERDEGEYAYLAWRMEQHELPYRDWVDQKPPGVFWVYRLALALPMDPVVSVHFLAMIFAGASAVALFLLASRWLNRFWATGAAILWAVLSADPWMEGTAANTEIFMVLPVILSQIALLTAAAETRNRIFLMVLAGALTGIAAAFKQVAILNWICLVALYPIFAVDRKRWMGTFFFVLWSGLGMAAVAGGIAFYFWCRHGLAELVGNVLTHNLEYISTIPWVTRWQLCGDTLVHLARSQALIWVFSIAGFAALAAKRRLQWLLFLGVWTATGLAGVSASGYFFPHYFQQLLPCLALAAAAGAEAVESLHFGKALWFRRLLSVLLLACLPAVTLYPFLFEYSPKQAVTKIYPKSCFAEMPEAGQRIARATRPEDRIFIFGAEPELFFYARRASATRYIFLFPLYGPYRNAHDEQVRTAKEIFQAEPRAALYLPDSLMLSPDTDQYFTHWSQVYLQSNFGVDAWLGMDNAGVAHLDPFAGTQEASVPADQHMVGAVMLRTTAGPGVQPP